jgi:hypothetical protein
LIARKNNRSFTPEDGSIFVNVKTRINHGPTWLPRGRHMTTVI